MSKRQKKILIAEDERPMARALELKLTHMGFTVVVVSNGEAALEAMHREVFDLLLLDLVMPKVDGFQVLEALHGAKKTIPVVIISNLSQPEDEQRTKQLGAKAFFIKSNTPIATIVTFVAEQLA